MEIVEMRVKEKLQFKIRRKHEIFAKSKKNYKSQTKHKINNMGKLYKILNMVEQMTKDMKLLREEQHECKKRLVNFEKKTKLREKRMNKLR